MGIEQLIKLNSILKEKIYQANLLTNYLSKLPGIITPVVRKNCNHVYYVYAIKLDLNKIKYNRKFIIKKLISEGIQGLSEGYINLSDLNLFKKKIAYGKKSFPWSLNKKKYLYLSDELKVCQELDKKSLISFEMCLFDLSKNDIKNIFLAFKKVWSDLKII